MNKKGNKIFSFIVQLLSILCLAILFIVAIFLIYFIVSNRMAKSNGGKPNLSVYTIVSESMLPKINVYDVVVGFKVKDESSLKVGDIIIFRSDYIDTEGYTITHRINEIIDEGGSKKYITKGDNNKEVDDGYITFDNIVGKVNIIIPKLGKIQAFISSKFGWLLVVIIPALGIILIDLFRLIKIYKIKTQIEEIPRLKEVEIVREKEEDKKIRALLEKADKVNKKYNEKE